MSDEFYVLVNMNDLNFYKDEYDDTTNINKAKRFYNLQDCDNELATFDDDVRERYEIYKVVSQLKTNFERVVRL